MIFIIKLNITYIQIERAIPHNNDLHIVNQDQNKYLQSAKHVRADQLNSTVNLMTKEKRKKISVEHRNLTYAIQKRELANIQK